MIADLLLSLRDAGIKLVVEGGRLAVPAGVLTEAQREEVRLHRDELIHWLTDPLGRKLMAAAMKVCDFWRDTPQARMQMRMDIWNTPPHLQQELLELFQQEYGV